MRRRFALVTLTLSAACSPSVVHVPDPTPHSASARPIAQRADRAPQSPPVLILAHRWVRGSFSVVEVRPTPRGYRLHSRRLSCATGVVTDITDPASRAELDRVLADLAPSALSEADPCATSIRDGTFWIVATSTNDPNKKTRQFRPDADATCSPFHQSALSLMRLATLTCDATGCYRRTERASKSIECP
jgi:hypothetical protein